MIDRAETLLHDHFGDVFYWKVTMEDNFEAAVVYQVLLCIGSAQHEIRKRAEKDR